MSHTIAGGQSSFLWVRLTLLLLFVSLTSLNAGIFAAQQFGGNSWPWIVGLAVLDTGLLAWLYLSLLRPLDRDLKRRLLDQEALRRSAQDVEDLYNRAPCGYHSLDAEGHFVRINDTALLWLGYHREDVLGRPFIDLLSPASRAVFRASFPEFLRRGKVHDLEYQFVRKDGTLLSCLLSSVAQRDAQGRFLMSRSTFIDITERKRVEERLADLSLRLQAVLDAAVSVAVVATDLDGRITLFNAGAERMLGYRASEMIGRECPWSMHLAGEILAQGERLSREFGRPVRGFDVLVERARQGGQDEREWTYVRKDGSYLTVNLVVTALRDAEGRITGFLCVATDVTERNRARERLQMTMSAARIGTWDWDISSGRCIFSDNVAEILALPGAVGEMTFEEFLDVIDPQDSNRVRAEISAALHDPARQDRYETEFRVRDSAGQVHWVEDKGRVFRDSEGVARHMMGTFMDVTARREVTEAQRLARDVAESANQAKSTFLASLSHEIRTPLGAIIGLVDVMRHSAADEEQRRGFGTLAMAAEGLLSLINDVLDISKIEAGRLDLEETPLDLRALVDEVAGVLSLPAQQKGLALNVALDETIPVRLIGDAGRLRQVLLNLVGNAVKFTSSGEVTITVQMKSEECRVKNEEEQPAASSSSSTLHSSLCTLHFSVRDTGIGIRKEKLEAIFEPFTQGDTTTARTHGGTGLGLTISSRLVERMGGHLRAESEPGKGSTFSFSLSLPVAEEAPARVAPVEQAEGPSLRVLLVEDNPVNQQVLVMQLERVGHQVDLANNGREALEALAKQKYDLVLMDLQMPEMDGLRCTRLIRQHEKTTGERVPIVAVTANALQGERQRCLQAGMDDYLAKPVRSHELAAVIARLLGRQTSLSNSVEIPARDDDAPLWLTSLREMGFDEEGINRLTRTFVETVPGRLEALRKAVAARDAEQVHKTAHMLKGSLAVFSARPALDAAVRLMVLSQENQPDGYPAALAELETEVMPVLASMTAMMEGT